MTILLSRDGEAFFHTSFSFFYYQAPGNFTAIYPGGGHQPTLVTLTGEGFLGFDGDAAQARCRWGAGAPFLHHLHLLHLPTPSAATTTTPVAIPAPPSSVSVALDTSATRVRGVTLRRASGRAIENVSLNAGADTRGRTFVLPRPVMVRTGCLGAVGHPRRPHHEQRSVTGFGFNVFVDRLARCRFLYGGGVYVGRIATRADADETPTARPTTPPRRPRRGERRPTP